MNRTACVLAVGVVAVPAFAQVGIDGVIGAEWSGAGVTTRTVTFDSGAATSNFGTPGTKNHLVAYTTYFRGDASYVYAAVAANPAGGQAAGGFPQFANLYFSSTVANGSVGMEVNNNRFFRGGVNTGGVNNDGYYDSTGLATWTSNSGNGVIEVAIPISFFTSDPLAMGFAVATNKIRFNLSQSFGYSVVGGADYNTSGGPDERLGLLSIPAPGAAAMMSLGCLLMARRRR